MVLNKETMRIEESLNITFDESLLEPKSSPSVEDDRIIKPVVQNPIRSLSLEANASELGYPKSLKEARGHLIEQDEEHWMMVMKLWSNIAWIQVVGKSEVVPRAKSAWWNALYSKGLVHLLVLCCEWMSKEYLEGNALNLWITAFEQGGTKI
nr:hypothetical protein [Tanacetum cinerariifolium]